MRGYCSNSPNRCKNAYSLTVLNESSACCKECGMFLVPAKHLTNGIRIDRQILQWVLLAITSCLLVLVYIHYANFV